MRKPIRILASFDYNASTGFATVSRNIVEELTNYFGDDMKMDIVANNYFGEPFHVNENIYVVSAKLTDPAQDDFGRHFFLNILKNSNEYDIFFVLNDLNAIVPIIEVLETIKAEKKEKNEKVFKSMYYFPLDCAAFYQILRGLEFFDILVTFTEYARKNILKVRPELKSKLKVIYHGTNTREFYPMEGSKIMSFREEFFGENSEKFIISNVNRNQPRKDIPSTIMAFKEARDSWNSSVEPFLYLHMHPKDPLGYDIRAILWQIDLEEGVDYKLIPDEWDEKMPPVSEVNKIMNASDAYLTTTLAEGWGLSVTEAMSCKLPVICPNNTSLSEITEFGNRAYVYDTDYPVINVSDNILRYQGSIYDIADCIKKVELHIKNNDKELQDKVDKAYKWASNLTWKEVCKRWIEYIKVLS